MAKKGQTGRLTDQHKKSKGVVGIFGKNAKRHDLSVGDISKLVLEELNNKYPTFDVMANMADKADIDYNYLVKTLSEWIFEGINDCTNNLYWNQVSHTKPHPTPKELLDFLHQIYIEKIDYYWDFKK